jgi:antitoxin VapB
MRYISIEEPEMADIGTAKLFKHGRSQAVRLPKEFRLPGTEVRVRRVGRGVLLEPIDVPFDVKAWFAKLDEYVNEPFMPEGRQQPAMPPSRKIFDE